MQIKKPKKKSDAWKISENLISIQSTTILEEIHSEFADKTPFKLFKMHFASAIMNLILKKPILKHATQNNIYNFFYYLKIYWKYLSELYC